MVHSKQQEIGEAAAQAEPGFYERFPQPSQWTSKLTDEWMTKAVKNVLNKLKGELTRHLPIADPESTPEFLEQIKLLYEKFESAPEMQKEKLYLLSTSAMPVTMKVKRLQRWNSLLSIRESHRFPKQGFSNVVFLPWLHKATWWAQVHIFPSRLLNARNA